MTGAIGVLFVLCGSLLAAEERSELSGLIQDTTGAVLVSAAVTAMHEDTGIRRAISPIKINYSVSADKSGRSNERICRR